MVKHRKRRIRYQIYWAAGIVLLAIAVLISLKMGLDLSRGWKLSFPANLIFGAMAGLCLIYFVLVICPRDFNNRFITKIANQYHLTALDLANISGLEKKDIDFRGTSNAGVEEVVVDISKQEILLQALDDEGYLDK